MDVKGLQREMYVRNLSGWAGFECLAKIKHKLKYLRKEGGGSVKRMLFFLRNPGDKHTSSSPPPPRWVTCVGLDVRVD